MRELIALGLLVVGVSLLGMLWISRKDASEAKTRRLLVNQAIDAQKLASWSPCNKTPCQCIEGHYLEGRTRLNSATRQTHVKQINAGRA